MRRHLTACEEVRRASAQSFTAVLGRGRGGSCCEITSPLQVTVGAAGEAEVGVVELAACGPVGRLEPGVKVVCDREPGFGLFVAVEDGGGSDGAVARYRDGQHLVVDGRVE